MALGLGQGGEGGARSERSEGQGYCGVWGARGPGVLAGGAKKYAVMCGRGRKTLTLRPGLPPASHKSGVN